LAALASAARVAAVAGFFAARAAGGGGGAAAAAVAARSGAATAGDERGGAGDSTTGGGAGPLGCKAFLGLPVAVVVVAAGWPSTTLVVAVKITSNRAVVVCVVRRKEQGSAFATLSTARRICATGDVHTSDDCCQKLCPTHTANKRRAAARHQNNHKINTYTGRTPRPTARSPHTGVTHRRVRRHQQPAAQPLAARPFVIRYLQSYRFIVPLTIAIVCMDTDQTPGKDSRLHAFLYMYRKEKYIVCNETRLVCGRQKTSGTSLSSEQPE
jgi:hypothetical protein